MTTMLDKAAKAVFDAAPFRDAEGPYEAQSDRYRALCRAYARAALQAIREVPEEISNVAISYLCTMHTERILTYDRF